MTNALRTLIENENGERVWISPEMNEALTTLLETRHGGVACVHGYIPTTNYIQPPVIDIQMITRFQYTRLLERRKTALEAITFEDVAPHINPDSILGAKDTDAQRTIFEARKAKEIASIDKTLSGDRSDAHRQAHDRCYTHFGNGIKLHLITEKDEDGYKQPVLMDGYPIADSIMVSHLELNRKVQKDGVIKQVNSGAPVLMSKAIKRVLNNRSVGLRMLSLRPDNFERLTIDRQSIIPEQMMEVM